MHSARWRDRWQGHCGNWTKGWVGEPKDRVWTSGGWMRYWNYPKGETVCSFPVFCRLGLSWRMGLPYLYKSRVNNFISLSSSPRSSPGTVYIGTLYQVYDFLRLYSSDPPRLCSIGHYHAQQNYYMSLKVCLSFPRSICVVSYFEMSFDTCWAPSLYCLMSFFICWALI